MPNVRLLPNSTKLYELYVSRQEDLSLLSNLLFWQDVTEYGAAEDRAADRLLRMCNAWAIFNKYVAADSDFDIGETRRIVLS